MNNDIIKEIDYLSRIYFAEVEKACRLQNQENWNLASSWYNYLCGYKACLESLTFKEEAKYLDKKLKIDIDK